MAAHVVMLGVVMFFMGMALGGLDNGRYLQEEDYTKVQCTTIDLLQEIEVHEWVLKGSV